MAAISDRPGDGRPSGGRCAPFGRPTLSHSSQMQLQSSENAIDYQTDKQTDRRAEGKNRHKPCARQSKGKIAIGTRKTGDDGPTKRKRNRSPRVGYCRPRYVWAGTGTRSTATRTRDLMMTSTRGLHRCAIWARFGDCNRPIGSSVAHTLRQEQGDESIMSKKPMSTAPLPAQTFSGRIPAPSMQINGFGRSIALGGRARDTTLSSDAHIQ